MKRNKRNLLIALAAASSLMLAACGSDATEKKADEAPAKEASSKITVVTTKSWTLSDENKAKLEKYVGSKVEFVNGETDGNLDAKLILRKDSPLGDATVGLTANNIIPVAQAGVIDPVEVPAIPGGEMYQVPEAKGAWAVDRSDVCANYDVEYFKNNGLEPPKDWKDLADPKYKGLLVAEDPGTSDTGLGMLLGIVQAFGKDGFVNYYKELKANDAKFVPSWKLAYNQEFSQGEGKGKYPIVMSYSSSPFWSVNKEGTFAPTANVPGTCYPYVEYAAVLKNAKNVEGGKKFVEWLRTPEGQTAVMDDNITYPIDTKVALNPKLEKFAPRPTNDKPLPAAEVDANRAQWIKDVQQVIGG